jgi:hypothetical protein
LKQRRVCGIAPLIYQFKVAYTVALGLCALNHRPPLQDSGPDGL